MARHLPHSQVSPWTRSVGLPGKTPSTLTLHRTRQTGCSAATADSQLAVFYTPEPDLVYLTMGTVDGNPECPPAYHQFAASKAPWHEITDGQPQHDTWPDD